MPTRSRLQHMDVEVRRASPADVADLAGLYLENHRFQAELVPEVLCEPSAEWTTEGLTTELLLMLRRPEQAIFLASSDGLTVGLVDVLVVDAPMSEGAVSRRYARVDNLVVTTDRRSSGVGSRLMGAAEEWARSKEIAELEVKIWDRPGGPLRFYETLSYVTISRSMVKALR